MKTTHFILAAALALSAGTAADAAQKIGKRESLPAPPGAMDSTLPALSSWICDDGQTAQISYDISAGVVTATRGAEKWTLQEQVGVNPRKFVSGVDTFALDGDLAELRRGRDHRATCAMVPAQPVEGRIWGTLSLPAGAQLPAGSKGKVMLVDAVRADAPSVELAATSFTTRGNQPPLGYVLQFEPEKAAPKPHTYRVQARIEDAAGKLLFITDTATFVLQDGPTTPPLELSLVAVGK